MAGSCGTDVTSPHSAALRRFTIFYVEKILDKIRHQIWREDLKKDIDGVVLECVKSNFGTVEFIPIQGRWVVERTFSWMDSYRRLTRNYERLLSVAGHMFIAGCVFFMLRYFA